MKSKLPLYTFIGILALSASTPAVAQSTTAQIQKRTQVTTTAKTPAVNQAKSLKLVNAAPAITRHAAPDPSQYGQVFDVINEDFSLMTDGSYGYPATDKVITYNNPDNIWITMSDGYTHESGWGGHSIYPAGGSVAMYGPQGNCNFNTPMLDLEDNDGVAFLRFKARTDRHNTDALHVEGAETFNMSPTWRVLESYEITDLSTEWKEYTFMFHNAGQYTLFNFFPYIDENAMARQKDSVAVYIDDVEVLQTVPYVNMPTGLGYRNYQGTSFDAYWNKVEGADSYLVNVYREVSPEGYHQAAVNDTILRDQPATDTTLTISNVESGQEYYFTVRAVKGDHKSYEPLGSQVYDLVAPEPKTDGIADSTNTYTVTWDPVPTAERYNYLAYTLRGVDNDTLFTVTDENYNNAVCPPESFSESFTEDNWKAINSDTPGSENYLSLSSYVVNQANQPGWIAQNGMPMSDGCIKIDGYQYVYNNQDAGLVSPELDLSKDGGKFTVNLDLKAQSGRVWFADNTYEDRTTRLAAALFNYDEQKEDYTQVELLYVNDLNDKWSNHTLNFTKGSERSVIGLYAVYAPENLFIDNLKITQNYKAGDTFEDPIFFRHDYDGVELTVTLPNRANNSEISHRMQAEKFNENTQAVVESKWSPLEEVGHAEFTNGIKSVGLLSNATVQVDGNNVIVNGDAAIYTIDGKLVGNAKAVSGRASINLPSGAYIVKSNGKTVKVVF